MHTRLSTLLVLLLVVALLGSGFTSAIPVSAAQAEPDSYTAQVIELINAEREAAGLARLRWHSSLGDSAGWLAGDMAAYNYVSHTDRLGRGILARLSSFGYEDYSALGENIAAGYATPAAVVAAWLSRSQHRANILNANYTELGVGYSFNQPSTYKHYWVLDFGARFDAE